MRKLLHADILKERLTIEESQTINRHPISVMVHNVRSLYNIGSLFRTCDSALVSELILCGFTPYPPRKEIEKTALGAVDTVPWSYYKDIIEAINIQKDKGFKIIALELTDFKRTYDSLTIDDFPACIVVGNELSGIDDYVLSVCDSSIEIPMYGVKHSLNVSVASGIAIYEATRLWHKNNNTV
jgi:23S rRNA (guanosine2251-2'-O)-methyltransferase